MEVERMRSWLDPTGQSVTCTHVLINVCVCAYIYAYICICTHMHTHMHLWVKGTSICAKPLKNMSIITDLPETSAF